MSIFLNRAFLLLLPIYCLICFHTIAVASDKETVKTYHLVNFAKPITKSSILPTSLMSEFFRLRRSEPEIDRNVAINRYVAELQQADRIALAQLLIDDRDIRVRAFAIATLSSSTEPSDSQAMLADASKRIGLAPIKRAAEYAKLKYNIKETFIFTEE